MAGNERPLSSDLADRWDRHNDCSETIQRLYSEYYRACALCDFVKADAIRQELIEAIEASLDIAAAFFKRFGGAAGGMIVG